MSLDIEIERTFREWRREIRIELEAIEGGRDNENNYLEDVPPLAQVNDRANNANDHNREDRRRTIKKY